MQKSARPHAGWLICTNQSTCKTTAKTLFIAYQSMNSTFFADKIPAISQHLTKSKLACADLIKIEFMLLLKFPIFIV